MTVTLQTLKCQKN